MDAMKWHKYSSIIMLVSALVYLFRTQDCQKEEIENITNRKEQTAQTACLLPSGLSSDSSMSAGTSLFIVPPPAALPPFSPIFPKSHMPSVYRHLHPLKCPVPS